MKRQFVTTTDEQGFIFPYVLFMVALALIILTASTQSYQSGINITHNQLEQLKIETLFQMSRAKFASEINKDTDSGTAFYEWPYGDAKVKYIQLNKQTYRLQLQIKTDNGANHKLLNQIKVSSE